MTGQRSFFRFEADSHRSLGAQLGETFRDQIQARVQDTKAAAGADPAAKVSCRLRGDTGELEAMAEAANVSLDALVVAARAAAAESTTVVTNDGRLAAHNHVSAADMCVVEKRVAGVTVLEVFEPGTLGGTVVSANSHGNIQLTDPVAVAATDDDGLPLTVAARVASVSRAPMSALQALRGLPFSEAAAVTILDSSGALWAAEVRGSKFNCFRPRAPFVRTNHFLGKMRQVTPQSSERRLELAVDGVRPRMHEDDLRQLLADRSGGEHSLLHPATAARVLVDVGRRRMLVWLRQEANSGWVSYPLPSAA